ncbi:MAG: DNA-binding protein [Phocaeicola sp.]
MAIQFDFYETPTPTPSEEKQYHPRAVSKPTLESDEILKQINHRCSLTDSDVVACLTELSHTLVQGLKEGRSVHLEGVGYFSIKLESTTPSTTTHTRSEHVKVKGIAFKPEKGVMKQLSTASLERASLKKHSASLSNAEIDAAIEQHFAKSPTLTRRQLEGMCQLNKGMALKHVNRLVEEGRLVNLTNRHQAVYGKVIES